MNNNTNNHRNDPNYEARKRAYYEKKRRDELEAAKKKNQRPYYIAVAAISLLIVICLIAAVVASTLFAGIGAASSYTLKVGSDKSEASVVNGEIMVNLDKLTDLLDLQKTGNAEKPKYTSKGGDSIQFSNGKKTAQITVSGAKLPTDMTLSSKITADSNGCFISLDTLSSIFTGITVTLSGETVKIERKTLLGHDDKLEEVKILNKTTEPLSRVLILTENMKKYEEYINPTDRDAYLVLANKKNALGSDYVPDDLIDLKELLPELGIKTELLGSSAYNTKMNRTAAMAMIAMLLDMRADEYNHIFAQSGYRDYKTQETIFNKYLNEYINDGLSEDEAREKVLEDTALPGTSEHQTGLCMDFIDDRYTPLTNPFASDYTIEWLEENAWKYGFILRYPEGDEDITGYAYESWHFRFVGRYHAERISAQGLTLEEYLEKTDK